MAEQSTKADKPADTEESRDVHRIAIERHSIAVSAGENQMNLAIEDTRFSQVQGKQWDDLARNRRKNRPMYEINKVQLMVNKVVGDQMQNRISPKVRPAGGEATKKVADTMNGLIRNIENQSNFSNIRNSAFKESATGGSGAWKIVTQLPDDDFVQDIRIMRIPSAVSKVFWDPSANDPNKRDAKYVFEDEEMPTVDFKEKWPGFAVSSVSSPRVGIFRRISDWFRQERVRVSDYWVKVPIKIRIAKLTDGRVVRLDEEFDKIKDELARGDPENGVDPVAIAVSAQGNEMIQERDTHKVVHYKISGGDILSGPNDWAGKFLPIVPIFGYSMHIQDEHHYRGLIRFAKDPQRVLNYEVSFGVETGALAVQDPTWLTHVQAQGQENQFKSYNVRNNPFLFYTADPLAPGPPRRGGPPAVNTAQIQRIQMFDGFIETTTGLFAPSLGDNPGDQSGVALRAQQAQGDSATFELVENLVGGIEYTGEIIIDLMPKIYDTERQIQIIQEDGETKMVTINQEVTDEETGDSVLLVNQAQDKYDMVVDVSPSYKTQRIEAINALIELGRNDPEFKAVSGDLIAKNLQFSESGELTKRLRRLNAQRGIVELSEEEIAEIQENQEKQQPQEPSPQEQAEAEALQLNVQRLQVENQKIQVETNKLAIENAKAQQELEQGEDDPLKEDAETGKIIAETGNIEADTEKKLSEANKNDHEVGADRIRLSEELRQPTDTLQ